MTGNPVSVTPPLLPTTTTATALTQNQRDFGCILGVQKSPSVSCIAKVDLVKRNCCISEPIAVEAWTARFRLEIDPRITRNQKQFNLMCEEVLNIKHHVWSCVILLEYGWRQALVKYIVGATGYSTSDVVPVFQFYRQCILRGVAVKSNTTPNHDTGCETSVSMPNATIQQSITTVSLKLESDHRDVAGSSGIDLI
ncbi:hypothetical protein TNCV_4569291 [Trichonephila clavipes]|nr:hypothetical protein TNCV_4569291 [Trichonephila clavipes]